MQGSLDCQGKRYSKQAGPHSSVLCLVWQPATFPRRLAHQENPLYLRCQLQFALLGAAKPATDALDGGLESCLA